MQFLRWRTQRTWGRLALGVWLIGYGGLALSGGTFPYGHQILALLAVVAGILILLER